jgi:hypothetical protein
MSDRLTNGSALAYGMTLMIQRQAREIDKLRKDLAVACAQDQRMTNIERKLGAARERLKASVYADGEQ